MVTAKMDTNVINIFSAREVMLIGHKISDRLNWEMCLQLTLFE